MRIPILIKSLSGDLFSVEVETTDKPQDISKKVKKILRTMANFDSPVLLFKRADADIPVHEVFDFVKHPLADDEQIYVFTYKYGDPRRISKEDWNNLDISTLGENEGNVVNPLSGESILINAMTKRGSRDNVRRLLEKGADPTYKLRQSPIEYAQIVSGMLHPEIQQMLLSYAPGFGSKRGARRKSVGRKSVGRKSVGRKSVGRKSVGRKSMKRKSRVRK